MKKIEDLLSKELFKIDPISCMEHAKVLRTYTRPIEALPWSSEDKPDQLIFKVAFISVCHQFNWDFLQSQIAEDLFKNRENILERLQVITAADVSDLLKDYPKQQRVRAKERAKLLRDIGTQIKNIFGDKFNFYQEISKTKFSDGSFHKTFDTFIAYSEDPLRKKTNILSHELVKESIIRFEDEEFVKPAIDYHIMRVYLRTGRVVPTDPAIFQQLGKTPNPRGTLVRILRESVSEAEELTAFYAGINVADLNYIEWQVARSICTNINPGCTATVIGVPDDVKKLCSQGCPYNSFCTAFNFDKRFIELEEPKFISRMY
ncbi:hypothetical protein [Marinobacter shengliensis]|uniref:hypothetical protein n=1 Tax=Marinobacter shengliensis TaxID=1389223 RepID=UPI0025745E99|nr:hypothetical protein [Marinobacter shengliensis]BEH15619.1 iron-sulfur cluster protein [Marinobacter shengliensis]